MNKFNILAIVFGFLLGALITSLVREPQLPISGLISAMTTVAIGWWIHRAVRRRVELDRIPIDYLSNLNRRIDELISACLGTATVDSSPERLVKLTPLANEIYWLRDIAARVQPELNSLRNELTFHYVDFKGYLTESDSVDMIDMIGVSNASRELRITALKVQWSICQHILDRKKNTDIFASL